MAKSTRICKVCGKEYEYCKTWNSTDKFRWQDVACSPECGAKYFARIEASRSGNTQKADEVSNVEVAEELTAFEEEVIEDEELAEEFEVNEEFDSEEAVG